MSNNSSGEERFKGLMNKPKDQPPVHDQFFGPVQKNNDNTSVNTSIEDNENLPDSVEVKVTGIPVAKKKQSIRETHKTKAFYIRNDLAKLIDKDIKTSRRGAMTEIVNALFEEYYRSQGRLK